MPPQAPYMIDGVFFQIGRSGIAKVWTKVFEQWLLSGFAEKVLVIDRQRTLPRLPGLQVIDAPAFSYNDLAADQDLLQRLCDAHGSSVFASTYYSHPRLTPSLLLVHDMIPEVLGWDLGEPMWRQKQAALRQAHAFAAVSEHTAKDLRHYLEQQAGRSHLPITLTPNGCDFEPASAETVADFRLRHGLHKPYFMLSGTRDNYKNASLFFEAFALLGEARELYQILCTGGGQLSPTLRALAGPATAHVSILSDADMAAAYSGATALVYPSLYEGFGLPVLEAMACGCPVLCTDAASLPEVGGEAPLYLPLSTPVAQRPAVLARQMQAVLAPSLRETLIARGLRQAARFDWQTTAHELAAALENLAAQTPKVAPPPAQRGELPLRLRHDDQCLDIGSLPLTIPAEHLLPRYLREHPLYDRFLPVLASQLPKGSLAIDVGANCGDTLLAVAQAQPDLHHLCIEPDQGFYAYMSLNAERLRRKQPNSQVELVQALVGRPGKSARLAGGGGSKHSLPVQAEDALGSNPVNKDDTLHTRSLDEIVTHSAMADLPVALIKSDVDGHDHDVLASAEGLIAKHRPLLYFECLVTGAGQQAAFHSCVDRLASLDYSDHWLFDNFGNFMVHATEAAQVHQVLDYVWRQHRGKATRSFYYVDVLSATPSSREIAASAVAAYCRLSD